MLVTTAALARELAVHATTVRRWHRDGVITPALVTHGGHARWDIERVREQLARAAEPATSHVPERPPVVAVIVTRGQQVLITERTDGVPPWGFPAGKVQAGESIADAAVREVKEETGLEVQAGDREIGRRVHPVTGATMIYLPATVTGSNVVPHVGDERELTAVRWVSRSQARTLMPDTFEPVDAYLDSTLGRRRGAR